MLKFRQKGCNNIKGQEVFPSYQERTKQIAITIFQKFTCPAPFWWELVKGVPQGDEGTEQKEVQGAAESIQPTALGM